VWSRQGSPSRGAVALVPRTGLPLRSSWRGAGPFGHDPARALHRLCQRHHAPHAAAAERGSRFRAEQKGGRRWNECGAAGVVRHRHRPTSPIQSPVGDVGGGALTRRCMTTSQGFPVVTVRRPASRPHFSGQRQTKASPHLQAPWPGRGSRSMPPRVVLLGKKFCRVPETARDHWALTPYAGWCPPAPIFPSPIRQ
jgi:hypothetical protein